MASVSDRVLARRCRICSHSDPRNGRERAATHVGTWVWTKVSTYRRKDTSRLWHPARSWVSRAVAAAAPWIKISCQTTDGPHFEVVSAKARDRGRHGQCWVYPTEETATGQNTGQRSGGGSAIWCSGASDNPGARSWKRLSGSSGRTTGVGAKLTVWAIGSPTA